MPGVTRDQVSHAKPDPDLFLTAARRLGVDASGAVVVGDSVWDLLATRRARALAWACCRVAMGVKSSSARAQTACTTTRGSAAPSRRSRCSRGGVRGFVRSVTRTAKSVARHSAFRLGGVRCPEQDIIRLFGEL